MQTTTQNLSNSSGYIKCGEILKSQKSFKDPYILRCIQCKEIYLLLESFIFHLDDTCKKAVEMKNSFKESLHCTTNDDEVENGSLECEVEPSVKLENSNAQMEDPLIVVKHEVDIDKTVIKVEPNRTEETSENYMQLEYCNMTENPFPEEEDNRVEEYGTYLNSQTEESESAETEPEQIEIIQKSSNTNGVSSAFVSNFMKSEKNVTVLIAAFKDQPQLWNKNMPHYGNKFKRREYMEKIAENLKNNHNININSSQVSAVVVHLYRKYQDNLHRIQERDETKKQLHITPWYLAKLNFIRPYVENFSLEILCANHPSLMSDQIVKILEIYRGLPHLWNSNLIENHCKNKRHESIMDMLKQLETNLNLKITENALEQYIRTIHNNFSREKRRILNNKRSNKASTNSEYYERLMFLYDHVPPLRCSVCGAESISPLHFKMHTSTHEGSLPFTCSRCNRTFKRVNVYISHAKRHLEDLNYICKECGKKFVNYTNLRLHMRIHTGDKPYCCEMCGESFRFLQTLSNHRRRHEKRYLHTCKICSQGFYSKMRHDDHMNSHMNIRSHVCDICNKAFITKRALQQHKVVHEDIRKFSCKLCSKTFKHKTGVNQHMKTHDIAATEQRAISIQ